MPPADYKPVITPGKNAPTPPHGEILQPSIGPPSIFRRAITLLTDAFRRPFGGHTGKVEGPGGGFIRLPNGKWVGKSGHIFNFKPFGAKNPFQGHIMFLWNAGSFNALGVAQRLKKAGYSGLAIKSHNGRNQYVSTATIDAYKAACRKVGLDFGLWAYVCDTAGAFAEGRTHAYAALSFGADFFIADAEIEYEQAKGPASQLYCQGFRAVAPHLAACLSSFGRIDFHPGIDWRTWSDHHFGFMPQAYSVDSSYLMPAQCVAKARNDRPGGAFALRAIYPTISVKSDVNGYLYNSQSLRSHLRGLPTKGSSVWEYSICRSTDFGALVEG